MPPTPSTVSYQPYTAYTLNILNYYIALEMKRTHKNNNLINNMIGVIKIKYLHNYVIHVIIFLKVKILTYVIHVIIFLF